MSATEREIMLRRVTSAVAARYLNASFRLAAWNMDMFARLSVLEGTAGVVPGTWLQQKERGFGAALDHFGPKLPAAWTSAHDQGLYDKAVATAARILRRTSGTDAMDVVQDMVSGSASPSGPARTKLFYSVGSALRKYENDLVGGQMTPGHRRIMGAVENWVTRAALDVVKSQKERLQQWSGKDEPKETFGRPGMWGTKMVLDDEERGNLLLLALQSPGGPGNEIRRIIDHEINQYFTPANRPIVRAFLSKIGQPSYRSPQEMKRLVSKFTPSKWFTQAYNLVRKEIMDEMGVSAQQLTNALGGNAKNVFRFMHDKVGANRKVQQIIEELAEEIELLEPGVSRVAKSCENKPPIEQVVLQRWLGGQNLDSLKNVFEKDEYKEWPEQSTPHTQYNRGPLPVFLEV